MRTYYIEERHMEMTYIGVRLLLEIDCELKENKINEILNYLQYKGFMAHLIVIDSTKKAEDYIEIEDVMSLTIDVINDKLRFKFWNGASIYWLFHVSDVVDILDTGRDVFTQIYDKYEPITEIFFDFKNRWRTSIHHISYKYHPGEDIELVYHIVFTEEVKNVDFASKLLDKINKEIIMLGDDITKGLSFKIEYSFKTSGCLPCQKAREEREKNERENKE